MSKIEVITRHDGSITFECDCHSNHSGKLCPECQQRVWLRLGQLVNQEKEPLIGDLNG